MVQDTFGLIETWEFSGKTGEWNHAGQVIHLTYEPVVWPDGELIPALPIFLLNSNSMVAVGV
jgi:hypothetical protein